MRTAPSCAATFQINSLLVPAGEVGTRRAGEKFCPFIFVTHRIQPVARAGQLILQQWQRRIALRIPEANAHGGKTAAAAGGGQDAGQRSGLRPGLRAESAFARASGGVNGINFGLGQNPVINGKLIHLLWSKSTIVVTRPSHRQRDCAGCVTAGKAGSSPQRSIHINP